MVLRPTRRRRRTNTPLRAGRVRPRGERGAILVLAALLLVAMLTMSAIAIDLSNARQQRRQSQGSADAAALAGAQDLPDAAAVVATVKDYALDNFGIAAPAWIGCTDPDHLPELPDSANSDTCISIDEAFSRVRVRLPVKEVPTYFAGVIGINTVSVSAEAVAEAQLKRDDRIIPATVAAASGSGNICIENGGNDSACAARTTGNFGSFDSRRTKLYLPNQNAAGRLAAHQLLHGRGPRPVHLRHRGLQGLRRRQQDTVHHHQHRQRHRRQPPDPLHRQRRPAPHRRRDRQRPDQHQRR